MDGSLSRDLDATPREFILVAEFNSCGPGCAVAAHGCDEQEGSNDRCDDLPLPSQHGECFSQEAHDLLALLWFFVEVPDESAWNGDVPERDAHKPEENPHEVFWFHVEVSFLLRFRFLLGGRQILAAVLAADGVFLDFLFAEGTELRVGHRS